MSLSYLPRRRFLAGGLSALVSAPTLLKAADSLSPSTQVPWLDQVQTPPVVLPPKAPKLESLLIDAHGKPITDRAGWERKRDALLRWWTDWMGTYHENRPAPPKLETIEEETIDGVVRQRVRYESQPGFATEAYLLRPEKLEGPAPGAVVFHSTVQHSIRQPAGVQGVPEKAFGFKLAKRGFVTFCPRNYLWTDNRHLPPFPQLAKRTREVLDRFGHPKAYGMTKTLFDAVQAVDLLAAQPGVDPKRLAAVGHSLGAKVVFYLAAFDRRIRATVSSEGGIGLRFSNWDAPWYLGPEIKSPDFTHKNHELLAAIAPRAFLLIGGDGADGDQSWPFVTRAHEVYRLYGEPCRLGLLNHHQGHALPPEAEPYLYQWLETYCS